MTTAKKHASHIKQKFGLTAGQYKAMLKQQGGVCAICGKPPIKKRLAVDHDHKKKKIRGLICSFCNYWLLGVAHTSPKTLRRAAEYLENPPGIPAAGGPPLFRRAGERILRKMKTNRRKKGGAMPL